MNTPQGAATPKPPRNLRWLALFLLFVVFPPTHLVAIPAFARKYKVSCSLCHAPFPRLSAFGEQFAANGFEFARGEPPRDTIATGDPSLRLQGPVPFAVRMDAYLLTLAQKGEKVVGPDLQTPWLMKILSGGQVADGVSYYLYFFLSERGEVAGLEDAYVQFSDVAGTGVDLIVGQFQVSDPLFKRELRLEYEDYQLYRARIGNVRADMTYERGLFASFSPWENGDAALMVVNGRGLSAAGANRQYDTDRAKNIFFRYSHTAGPLRLGGFLYAGQEKSGGLTDRHLSFGPDLTLSLGEKTEVNAQYLRRTDSNPFFLRACSAGDPRCGAGSRDPFQVRTEGLMVEVHVFPQGPDGKWALSGLYNSVESNREALSLRSGEQGFLRSYESVSAVATYLLARNLKLSGEVGYDTRLERARLVMGVVTAF